ncbi:MAG: hypothetical protein HS111_07430 [Kofleriaceae bacterium]|nr:hypothetical protein [Kofleriaceae bacterium]
MRRLRDELATAASPLPHLSMGMSGDFAVAIAERATLVRIGTAIFGERPPAGDAAARVRSRSAGRRSGAEVTRRQVDARSSRGVRARGARVTARAGRGERNRRDRRGPSASARGEATTARRDRRAARGRSRALAATPDTAAAPAAHACAMVSEVEVRAAQAGEPMREPTRQVEPRPASRAAPRARAGRPRARAVRTTDDR